MEDWRYRPTDDFDRTPLERLGAFPRHPDMFVYALRYAIHLFLRGYLRLYHRMRIVGRERLPLDRPFVMVANHGSHLDALSLMSALPLGRIHDTYPAAARDYFFTTMPKTAFFAIAVNAMPFDRRENPRDSLAVCHDLLTTPGHVLILFPEGTRTTTGELGAFKPGIGFLTAGLDVPVVPCWLEGAWRAWPKGAWIPRPRRLELRIGEPLSFAAVSNEKEEAKRIAALLRERVAALGGLATIPDEVEMRTQ